MTGSDEVGDGEAAGPVLAPERPPTRPPGIAASGSPPDRGVRFWSHVFPALIVALALLVPTLLVTGRNVVMNSTASVVDRQVTDPAAPGWEAVAEPTPVALVLQRSGPAGALAGITLVSLTGTDTGAVVFIPVDTVAAGGDQGRTLAEVAAEGEPALRSALESLLGLTASDIVTLDAPGWRRMVEPAVPLTVENPDAVFTMAEDKPVLRFARGPITLTAADAPEYLELRNFGERDLNRMVRHEVFWRALLQAAGQSRPGPGTAPAGGLDRYVDALAAGRVDMSTLPVQAVSAGGLFVPDRFVPVTVPMRDLLARVVPFPTGGPHRRLRIRLLDGVGTLHHGLDAAGGLVARRGQIDRVGNAPSFGVPKTKLEYTDESLRWEVEALAGELGVGEIVKVASIEGGTDVSVTLGQDYVEARATGQGGTGG